MYNCNTQDHTHSSARMDNIDDLCIVDCSDGLLNETHCHTSVNREVFDTCCVHADMMTKFTECVAKCTPTSQGAHECAYLSFFGFGSIKRHETLVRVLEETLRPALLHSSFVKDANFEGIVSVDRGNQVEAVERLLDCFAMGIGTVDIDTFMGNAMVACLERIETGKYTLGNIHTPPNRQIRAHLHMLDSSMHVIIRVAAISSITEQTREGYEIINDSMFLNMGSILYTPSYMQVNIHINTPEPPSTGV